MKKAPIIAILLIAILLVSATIFTDHFEKDKPQIDLPPTINWNLKSPILVRINDAGAGLYSVKIALNDGEKIIPLSEQRFEAPQKDYEAQIAWPKGVLFDKTKKYTLQITASDATVWRFFDKNTAQASSELLIDTTPPKISITANSRYITQGGSAAVVFAVSDTAINEIFIRTKSGKIFKPVAFKKPGTYASLIAWDAKEDSFAADVVATDMAGNQSKAKIPLYFKNRQYKTSKIPLTQKFLDGKIEDLQAIYAPQPNEFGPMEKFKFVNETLRDSNEKIIEQITSNIAETEIGGFYIEPFKPLKNGAAVGSFGDHRFFTHDGGVVSESWHMGLDLASVARAPLFTSNAATVAYAEDNGIYGKNLILYHGFGLYSLYAHCDEISVAPGDQLTAGAPIGRTGSTGLALGDHLHFGILVQGTEVRPEEWMDKKWMNESIFSILNAVK